MVTVPIIPLLFPYYSKMVTVPIIPKEKLRVSGRPPRLNEEGTEKLREYLKEKPFWTTKEVRCLIKERFEVELSEDQTRRILKDKLKMNFSKPYSKDYRRSKDAEDILVGNLLTVMGLLKEKDLKEKEIAIGFLDESSPQLTANTVRVWSFGKANISALFEKYLNVFFKKFGNLLLLGIHYNVSLANI